MRMIGPRTSQKLDSDYSGDVTPVDSGVVTDGPPPRFRQSTKRLVVDSRPRAVPSIPLGKRNIPARFGPSIMDGVHHVHRRVQIVISRPHGPPQQGRLKLILGGICFAAISIGTLIAALILGWIVATAICLTIAVVAVVLVLKDVLWRISRRGSDDR